MHESTWRLLLPAAPPWSRRLWFRVAVVVAALFLANAAVAQRRLTFSAPNNTIAGAGTIGVNFEGFGDENRVSFSVLFDPAVLRFDAFTRGSGVPGGGVTIDSSRLGNGLLGVDVALATGAVFPTGVNRLVDLGFTVLATTSSATSIQFYTSPVRQAVITASGLEPYAVFDGSSLTALPGVLAPRLTSADSMIFFVGERGSFSLGAAGFPAPTFALIAGALPSWASLDTASGLIAGTPPSTAGAPFSFTIKATNSAGTATQAFTLNVRSSRPTIQSVSAPRQVVGTGKSLVLKVTATDAESYQWKRNGLPIAGATSASLTIANAVPARDSGWYQVTVGNASGARDSVVVFVNVVTNPAKVFTWWQSPATTPDVPIGLANVAGVAAGGGHYLVLGMDGTVSAWGANASGQASVPLNLADVVGVAAGAAHSVALKADGTVSVWGAYFESQQNIPAGLANVVAVAAGGDHTLALKLDGTVAAWGEIAFGLETVPVGLTDVVSVACGYYHNLVLKRDGTVVAWGNNEEGQTNVPAGLTNVVAIAAGDYHCLALKADGTVVAWGYTATGVATVPTGLSNVVALAARSHSLALKSDGTLVEWGTYGNGNTSGPGMPAGLTDVTHIGAGGASSLAVRDVSAGEEPTIYSASSAVFFITLPGSFRVKARGTPAPIFSIASGVFPSWATLDPTTGIISGTPPTTVISPFAFTIRARNSQGSATQSFLLKAEKAPGFPVFTVQPIGHTAVAGTSVSLSSFAAGGAAVMQWTRNGVPVSGATDRTLTFTSVQKSDAGEYQAIASGSAGTESSDVVRLIVVDPVNAEYRFTTLAGVAGAGSSDGMGSAARFRYPYGVAEDLSGNVYVTDSQNHTIRKVTAGGVVTTLAGQADFPGGVDGVGGSARFNGPRGIAVAPNGDLFVCDYGNMAIRKITAAGVVTTVAGYLGNSGSADGTGVGARFSNPEGIVLDPVGNAYVADAGNSTIRKVVLSTGVVSTVAGRAGFRGATDGMGEEARFLVPIGITIDSAGSLIVVDSGNALLRKINPAIGVVTTLSMLPGGSLGGLGVAVDGPGNVFLCGSYTHAIWKISPDGSFTLVAGQTNTTGAADGLGSAARFNIPQGLVINAAGTLTVADYGNHTLRRISPAGQVTTLAGIAGTGYVDGVASAARFNAPQGVAIDGGGNIHVSDNGNRAMRRVSADGIVSTVASVAYSFGGLALDAGGSYSVAGLDRNVVFRVTSGGVTSIAAGDFEAGAVDGEVTVARFYQPRDVARDSAGNLYVADAGNRTIRKIAPSGVVSTLAGLANQFGVFDGGRAVARFGLPSGVAVDAAGVVYVADLGANAVRRVALDGTVTTIAGGFENGHVDNFGDLARFDWPSRLAVDAGGNIFVVDASHTIRLVTPAGLVTTIGGQAYFPGGGDGSGANARFWGPGGIAVDGLGRVIVADTQNNTIRVGVSVGPVFIAPPSGRTMSVGDSATLSGSIAGTGPFAYQWKKDGVVIAGATAPALAIPNASLTDAGSYTLTVTNSLGSATTSAALVAVLPSGNSATHAVAGLGFIPGGTVTINNTLSYSGSPTSLGWQVLLPPGWSYAGGSGSEGGTKPAMGTKSLLEWHWHVVPTGPAMFSYTLNVPVTASGASTIVGLFEVSLPSGTAQVLVRPDPLVVNKGVFHSADTNRDDEISLSELLRVIELYNFRSGNVRTGQYTAQPGTEDNFVAGMSGGTLTTYHSADIDRDGRLSLSELLRVIEFYNYRSGTVRTGRYRLQWGTEDGFAAGP